MLPPVRPIIAGLDQLEAFVPQAGTRNEAVSNWSVGQQISHLLLVGNRVLTNIANKAPVKERRPISIPGRVVLLVGRIPRGRNAPKEVIPPEEFPEFSTEIARLRNRFQNLSPGDIAGFEMNHPYFGTLQGKHWLRFVDVHQRHHLRIIREIVAKRT